VPGPITPGIEVITKPDVAHQAHSSSHSRGVRNNRHTTLAKSSLTCEYSPLQSYFQSPPVPGNYQKNKVGDSLASALPRALFLNRKTTTLFCSNYWEKGSSSRVPLFSHIGSHCWPLCLRLHN
jgi:hypothetical protein